jgi:RNA polymerase I-specific transcription initiation factor RRN6
MLMHYSLDIADTKIDVSDVDQASLALQRLLSADTRHGNVEVRCIANAELLHLGNDEEPTISALYDEILQHWIAPLPPQAPKRVRQHKERLARRIATEVTLATRRTFHRETQSAVVDNRVGLSQDSGISMPILPSQPIDDPGSSQNWASSQSLPTPPISQSQSSQPTSSQTPTPSSQFASSQQHPSLPISTLADPITRLRRHLYFTDDVPSDDVVSDGVSRLLSQWQLGTDPRTYDWDASERAIRIESVEGNDQQQLEKARKRNERRERRQQRENEVSRAQPSSQPFSKPSTFVKPTVYPRSSPGPMLEAINQHVSLPGASSQSQGFATFPFPVQSQVEPGRFGGRPMDKKKKKKGRVSGF